MKSRRSGSVSGDLAPSVPTR